MKKNVLIVMIVTSVITAIIGLYIGFILKDIILLTTTLITIELFIVLVIESAGIFKDRLSKKQLESAKSFDVQKLKKSGKEYLGI